MEQRVLFEEGKQREFLNLIKMKLNIPSIREILQFGFDIPYSTLKNYYIESLSLPKEFFEDLCHLSKINPNKLKISYLENNWGQIKGGKKGIRTLMKRYPKKMKKWRKLAMLNSPVIGDSNLKKIKIPKLDEKLAEFIGVYLGDGTLTKYFIRISGDYRYELPYYNYLSKLIFELFQIKAVISKEKNKNTLYLTIFSKNLCSFFHKSFNIKYGHKIKNNTIIPKKILESKKLFIACLRGLIDTDGSVTRRGNQFSIEFTSHNKLLLGQVYKMGKQLGIFTFCDRVGTGTNSWKNIVKYFEIVGSSNLKHIIRFHLKKYNNKAIYVKDLSNYFEQDLYKNISLPFQILGV